MFELMDGDSQNAVIKVLGVGGGGGNAVQHMVAAGIEGVEYMCVNTDVQALKKMDVRTTMQIGASITKGLGAGANPSVLAIADNSARSCPAALRILSATSFWTQPFISVRAGAFSPRCG